jgi:hypothetical protein
MPRNDETAESRGHVVELRPRRSRRLIQVLVDAGAWDAFVAAALTLGAGDIPGRIGEVRSIEPAAASEGEAIAVPVDLEPRK